MIFEFDGASLLLLDEEEENFHLFEVSVLLNLVYGVYWGLIWSGSLFVVICLLFGMTVFPYNKRDVVLRSLRRSPLFP